MRRLLLGVLLALALALPIQAQTQGAEELADGALEKKDSALQDVLDGVGDAGEAVGDAVAGAGRGIGDAAGAVGRAFAAAARAVGDAALAAVDSVAAIGLVASLGLSQGLLATAKAASLAFATLGAATGSALVGAGSTLASAVSWAAAAVAAAFQAAWSLVSLLRPRAVPEPAFSAVAASGAAASSAAGAYGLWSLLRKYGLVGLGPLAGFSRIADDELLKHPLRTQVFQAIQGRPGIHASELARTVGVGWGTITHHLDKLEKAGLVTTRKVNNQKCFFEQGGAVSRQDMAVASAVRAGTASEIAAFVTEHPMTSQKSMAEALGVSPALASFHVKKLVHLGVLDKMRRGKETLLTTSESLRRVLAAPATPVLMAPAASAGVGA